MDGQVIELVPFGAFVRVDGVDGLAPGSEWPTTPETGNRLRARILAIDPVLRRFSLGLA
ncbi:MAG: S1 RNA-binding domain-containing protein [Kineosporiaceae bacterium]|nr:S1 RNA-binding domain-containing protein [Kineosporiaceae bacterium]